MTFATLPHYVVALRPEMEKMMELYRPDPNLLKDPELQSSLEKIVYKAVSYGIFFSLDSLSKKSGKQLEKSIALGMAELCKRTITKFEQSPSEENELQYQAAKILMSKLNQDLDDEIFEED